MQDCGAAWRRPAAACWSLPPILPAAPRDWPEQKLARFYRRKQVQARFGLAACGCCTSTRAGWPAMPHAINGSTNFFLPLPVT